MRVLIDGAHLGERGGARVYVEQLVAHLDADVEVAEAGHRYTNLAAEALWQARLARRARGFDVLHHPLPALAPGGAAQVVTVQDLSFVREPECFNARFRISALVRHRRAARGARVVIAPSEATADDVRSRWSPRSVVVAPYGPGQAPRHDRGEPRHFLYVGDDEPRKNLGRLRAAHELYRQRGGTLELVVAGAAGRTVSKEELADLHRHAAALVIPSLHEGFGFTALEAMHAGTPVLAARTAALAELCAGAARFCDPRDTESIAAALTELAAVGPLREELRRRGLARAEAYSWSRCADAHRAAYTLAVRP